MATALNTKQVALSTTAAVVVAASSVGGTVSLKNKDASIVIYVGKAGVTAATGYRLGAGESVTIECVQNTPAIYAVAASGTPTVMVMRVVNE